VQDNVVTLNKILQRATDDNEPVDLFQLFTRFTFEVISEIAFGVKLGGLEAESEHPVETAFNFAQQRMFVRFLEPTWWWQLKVAGRRDSTAALSWFFYTLTQHPEAEAKIHQNSRQRCQNLVNGIISSPSMAQANELVYLEAVVKEALRLNPAVPSNIREALRRRAVRRNCH
ncbi:putative cytochrome P450, partial [Phytophthora cinnamomi]|uniref:putative cytochrome P450 n=1 Tax=Phytophthora cinnamomi TaxID=4785 RepID=UPI00355A1DBE